MTTTAIALDHFTSIAPFRGLSQHGLRQLAASFREVEHGPGHVIIEEGSTGHGFHLIVSGTVLVESPGRQPIRLGPHDYFGLVSLIDGKPREATVTAETDVQTLMLSPWSFHALLDREPALARELLVGLCQMVRDAQQLAPVACC